MTDAEQLAEYCFRYALKGARHAELFLSYFGREAKAESFDFLCVALLRVWIEY